MKGSTIAVCSGNNPELQEFLAERLYEYNAETSGIDDGRWLWSKVETETGELIAGVFGHTWGGCCEITQLWVAPDHRGQKLGESLILAAEKEAKNRKCTQMVLSTHSFQAPGFYEKLGYSKLAEVPEYPRGYLNEIYRKYL